MKNGFTLAEVLITLGVIGVVAALTLPVLSTKAREKATVAKVQETFSMLSQAYKFAEGEFGTPEGWVNGEDMNDPQSHIDIANAIKPYLKISDDCVGKDYAYVQKHCTEKFALPKDYASVRLINGVTLIFRSWYKNCDRTFATGSADTCGQIVAELKPLSKRPSENGVDTFEFFLTNKGIIPFGKENSIIKFEQACNKNIMRPYPSFYGGNMFACAAWVIYIKNMDYLHCSDLSWKGKHTCR